MRYLLTLAVLGLAACQSNPFSETPDRLKDRVLVFESVVRWGALENAYAFYRPAEGEVVRIPEGLDNVRVTGYEASPLGKLDELRWAQTAIIDYVLVDRQVVRQVTDNQIWISDDDGKTWMRENPVPAFH